MNQATSAAATMPANPPPPIGYPIGTILHGTNAKIGNLWVITVDNSFQATLLYDGKNKCIAPILYFKTDTMRVGMLTATVNDAEFIMGKIHLWPQWAYNIAWLYITPQPLTITVPQINQPLFGIRPAQLGLTKPVVGSTVLDSTCPSRKDGMHDYKQYYGFREVYEYCRHCDKKRNIFV